MNALRNRSARWTAWTVSAVLLLSGWCWAEGPSDDEVDQLLRQLSNPSQREQAGKQLGEHGHQAVGRLVHHLKSSHPRTKLIALMGLQYAWADEAVEPVLRTANDENEQVRRLARLVLELKLPAREFEGALEKAAGAKGPGSMEAQLQLLTISDDPARMVNALAQHGPKRSLLERLTRYHSPDVREQTRKLLADPRNPMRRTVLLSLMYQNDTAPETLKLVAMQLRNGNAGIRDVACEYLRYYGLPEHKKELEQRLRIDPDRYVRASAAAAIEAIDRREQRFKVEGEALAPPEPGEGQSRMQAWARRLREQPTRKMKAGALEALGKELPVSLYLRYGGRDNQPPRQVLEAHHAWTVLLNLAVGSDPSRAGSILHRSRTRRGGERPEAPEPDEARRFIPPLRGYFDPRRRSFARRIGSGSGPFSGSVHVGDDCGAHQEQTPVVAIADGTVRYLSISGLSWGSIVVLEHVLPDKTRFCSLYAHLGPVPCVALGQKVRAGQKLGSLARAFTFDNGGYFTHLHFGIHQGPYAEGQWITGYVDPKRFAKDQAGWVDPQQFLRARIAGR